jgi:hypothetical protein
VTPAAAGAGYWLSACNEDIFAAMLGEHVGEDDEPATVLVGIETDGGGWVQALIAAGYQIYAINP